MVNYMNNKAKFGTYGMIGENISSTKVQNIFKGILNSGNSYTPTMLIFSCIYQ